MAYVQSTTVYAWKQKLLGKPSFKSYRMYLYGNGRLLLENEESEKSKGSVNVCEIFPYIRVGALNSDEKKDRAIDQSLTLAYHTLIIPMESVCKNATFNGWKDWEFAFSFDREIREWMERFAQILSFRDQFDDVVKRYGEKRKFKSTSSTYGFVQQPTVGDDDPAILWSTARGASDDYFAIWNDFLESCSANVGDAQQFVQGNGNRCFPFH